MIQTVRRPDIPGVDMALRTGNGTGGLFMPVGMAEGLPDAHGSGWGTHLGHAHDTGAWIASGGVVAGTRLRRGAEIRCSQRNVLTGRRCGIRVAPWKRTAWVGGAVLRFGWTPRRCLTRSGGGCGGFPGNGGDWVCLRGAPFVPEAAREEDQSGHHHDNYDPGDVPGALETTDRLGFVNDHSGF